MSYQVEFLFVLKLLFSTEIICLICKEDVNETNNNKYKSNYESYLYNTYEDTSYINCIEDCGEN